MSAKTEISASSIDLNDHTQALSAEYWREQNGGNKRMAKLREARLAQEKAGTPKPKRKVSVGAHRKTHGFDRWS